MITNGSFKEKLEKVQYSEALIITEAIKDTFQGRFYKEIGLESLSNKRWYNKLFFFYKMVKGLAPYNTR